MIRFETGFKSQKSVSIKPEKLASNENIPNLNIDVYAKSSTSSINLSKIDKKNNLIISTPNFEEDQQNNQKKPDIDIDRMIADL